ncbi:MAG: ABC transporter ATP-binding protein [Firmicutes bacterium]|nr:ABC transporter ATP-binding protein [Bacillota bacterium]
MERIDQELLESKSTDRVASRLAGYLKPYIGKVIFCIVLVLLLTALELIRPILIGDGIDTYISGYTRPYAVVENSDIYYHGKYLSQNEEDVEKATSFSKIVQENDQYYYYENLSKDELEQPLKNGTRLTSEELKTLRKQDIDGMVSIGVKYVIVLFFMLAFSTIQMLTLQKMGQDIIYTMRKEMFHHVHSLPLRYFDTHPIGKVVTRVTNDVESLNEMYSRILIRLFQNGTKIVGYALVMFLLNRRLALYCFIFVPIISVLTYTMRTLSRKFHREIRSRISLLNTFLSENISGMRLIQIFANEFKKQSEFEDKSKELYGAHMKQVSVNALFRPIIYFLSQLALALVIYVGAKDVLSSVVTIGTLYVFVNYISSFFEPIQEMAEAFSTLQNAMASAEKYFSVMDEISPIVEKEDAMELKNIRGKIEFRNVTFAYDGEHDVLKDISFVIEPGQKVAFVGATGAGKSSILNVLERFYDIKSGEVLIDDINIKDLTLDSIRRSIGMVQQDVFIFTGDIETNIKLFDEDLSDAVMIESAQIANAHTFIEKLPHQYKEPVSERGSTLSSGQRQLLSFARTLAHNPKILVMDEATANIDTETEHLIQDALEKMMVGRTTIMVAHRLSTIQHADTILVMHHGRIVERGNHQELLRQDGVYKKLYELQLFSA